MAEEQVAVAAKKGLEDVVAGDSKICRVDGQNGRLYYRGYSIEDLAANCTFEEVTYLLLYEKLPNRKELKDFSKLLKEQRALPKNVQKAIKLLGGEANAMEVLRTAVSALGKNEPDERIVTLEEHIKTGISLIAKFPTIVAYFYRINSGQKPIRPKKKLGHAANFLYMLTGKEPSEIEARAMDMDFVLHVEHSFNASTFAVRITVSTLSDMYSAMTTGIGVLKGPLHGGAAQAVMSMLKKIGSVGNVENYVKNALEKHEKIMGIGHRVYKVYDPRARILKVMAKELNEHKRENVKLFEMALKVEEVMAREKNLFPNVDFFSSIVYHDLGLPVDVDSPVFAIARVSGWTAHALEQYGDNRLIRPLDNYTGQIGLEFVPLNKRR